MRPHVVRFVGWGALVLLILAVVAADWPVAAWCGLLLVWVAMQGVSPL